MVSGWKSATRTKARVAWNVVLCCSNRASICSLALILLSQTRWIVMPCSSTSISPQPLFKHVWIVVPCLSASISLQPCVSNTFELWSLVCLQASVSSPVFQTRLIMVACLSTSISLQPTRLIMVACLLTSISLEPKWLRYMSDGDSTPRGVGFRLKIAESIWRQRSTKVFGQGLASIHF